MTFSAWRIVKARHAASAFLGEGAEAYGGRWTSPGGRVVYTAGSASLAMLEMLVHLHSAEILKRYVLFKVSFSDSLIEEIDADEMPANWRKSPPPAALQRLGDAWLAAGKSAVLRVPSAVVPTESNYLLNPAHPAFKKIKIGPSPPNSTRACSNADVGWALTTQRPIP